MSIIIEGNWLGSAVNMGLIILMSFFVILVPLFLVMHFLMPKQVLDKYWTSTYFQNWEIAMFSYFPGVLMRTVMLTCVMTIPKLGAKRNMTEINLDVPGWYLIYARIYTVMFVLISCIFIFGLFGLYTYVKLSGRA